MGSGQGCHWELFPRVPRVAGQPGVESCLSSAPWAVTGSGTVFTSEALLIRHRLEAAVWPGLQSLNWLVPSTQRHVDGSVTNNIKTPCPKEAQHTGLQAEHPYGLHAHNSLQSPVIRGLRRIGHLPKLTLQVLKKGIAHFLWAVAHVPSILEHLQWPRHGARTRGCRAHSPGPPGSALGCGLSVWVTSRFPSQRPLTLSLGQTLHVRPVRNPPLA